MIRVLVVDDSEVDRALITHILQFDSNILVIDIAKNGIEAIQKVKAKKPDIVLMDIHMPKMGGVEAIQNIMSSNPVPIIVVSSSCVLSNTMVAFEAMDAGAISIFDKAQFNEENQKEITQTIKLMAEIKVVRRFKHLTKTKETVLSVENDTDKMTNLIGIGASTGGPNVLLEIFNKLSDRFPPIVVVQHIPASFLEGLVEWLKQATNHKIKIAVHSEKLEPNIIYFAPTDFQIEVQNHLHNNESFLTVALNQKSAENGHRPSASVLFRSMANKIPKESLGILLTGMGRDGADGLKLLRENGGTTIAQDEKSCVIYGMPGEAVAINAAKFILDPDAIANFMNNIRHEI